MHLKTDTSSNSHFATVPTISHSRNSFSIAQKHVSTCQFDYLYPIFWRYTYPGDTFNMQQAIMARLQTQIAPLYDDLYFDVHAWFVPFRLIQTNWARFQFNAQPAGPSQDNSSLTTPKIDLATLGSGGFPSKSLYDYFGFPTKVNFSGNTEHINNYLGRAYNLIWNDNYRDENLQNPAVVDLDEGPDLVSDYVLLKRGRRHDLFASCLPFAQKGTSVTLPLGTSAPILASTDIQTLSNALIPTFSNSNFANSALRTSATNPGALQITANGVSLQNTQFGNQTGIMVPIAGLESSLTADLTSATAATLNQVRQSYAVQHLLEADARGGTRDVESIQHRWGVTVPDFRLQRPEYLGGQTFTFDGHLVPQTSATSGSSYQAGLTQFSQAMSSLRIAHSFVEHGVFMILLSLRSNITYQEGLDRVLSYRTRYDFYQPEFANLGEVAVLAKEIYAIGSTGVQDNTTFGFQEYGYELRYSKNFVSGEMRSNYTTSLDSRVMADDYSSLPTLGSAWIQSNTPISRNIAISASTADPVQLNMMAQGSMARTLPMFSIPGLKRL